MSFIADFRGHFSALKETTIKNGSDIMIIASSKKKYRDIYYLIYICIEITLKIKCKIILE